MWKLFFMFAFDVFTKMTTKIIVICNMISFPEESVASFFKAETCGFSETLAMS